MLIRRTFSSDFVERDLVGGRKDQIDTLWHGVAGAQRASLVETSSVAVLLRWKQQRPFSSDLTVELPRYILKSTSWAMKFAMKNAEASTWIGKLRWSFKNGGHTNSQFEN